MSEITGNREYRLSKLHELSTLLLRTGNARQFILENENFIGRVEPSDFLFLFDELVDQGHPMEDLKRMSNKILNIFHRTITAHHNPVPEPGSLLAILEQNNREMEQVLNSIRPVYKSYFRKSDVEKNRTLLIKHFEKLEEFNRYYVIKENILFPFIEKHLPEHRCLQIMWSFHDEIRKNIRSILDLLKDPGDVSKVLNRSVGDVFFQMMTIKFREEHIIFPYILSTLGSNELEGMKQQAFELGFPYVQPEERPSVEAGTSWGKEFIDLTTGALSAEQLRLIFSHLPVDITFVDEHDRVRFFSATADKVFPRTRAIIGRDVHNCHPPDSVHVVDQIIQSFRSGEKDEASFWIHMKDKYILIRYFALRNESGVYKGVLEVTQEIAGIQKISGEKRLLDW